MGYNFSVSVVCFGCKWLNIHYVLISYIVIPVFWVLDGFYISIERQYRDLYNNVAQKTHFRDQFVTCPSSKILGHGMSQIGGLLS